jgi:chromosome segregation ATPase
VCAAPKPRSTGRTRAARERASAARSAERGEQRPAPLKRDFTDLADRVSALRKRTAAAAARLAETEEQIARVNDELAAREPGKPGYKRRADEAREAMRRARETEQKYSSS